MQKDVLTEYHLPEYHLKTPQNISPQDSNGFCYVLEDKEFISNNAEKRNKPAPSDSCENKKKLSISVKNVSTINGEFILRKPLELIENSSKTNQNEKRFYRKSSDSVQTDQQFINNYKNKSANCDLISGAQTIYEGESNVFCNYDTNQDIKKTDVHLSLNSALTNYLSNDSLPLCSKSETFKIRLKKRKNSDHYRENAKNDFNDATYQGNESKPFCVISEVIGNADAAFSGTLEKTESSEIEIDQRNLSQIKESDFLSSSNFNRNLTKKLQNHVTILKKNLIKNATDIAVSEEENVDKLKNYEISLTDSCYGQREADVLESSIIIPRNTEFQEDVCNEDESFVIETEKLETQLITPKKTTDITKIKGWRRKQFLVEKPTTVEFFRITKRSRYKKNKVKKPEVVQPEIEEEPGDAKNAFVCDSLDEFLDKEAELKIGYEIPHLYAEVGIKLTSDDIVSRPNLSEEDFKEVGSRYCIPVPAINDDLILDEKKIKSTKRTIENDFGPCKALKIEGTKKRLFKSGDDKIENVAKSESATLKPCETVLQEANPQNNNPNFKIITKLIGLVSYPGPSKPLHPIVRQHLDKIRSYRTKIDKNWADFAASAVVVKNEPYKRKILPVYCCVKTKTGTQEPKCEEKEKIVEKTDSSVPNEVSQPDSPKKCISDVKYEIKLKECRVVIKKINSVKSFGLWCMEHSCYDCSPCGLAKTKPESSLPKQEEKKDGGKSIAISPQASFDKKIANLLAKKLGALKLSCDTLTSIDCLKTLVPNTVEFIKLNFVKESFLSGYINIWYLKPQTPSTRSRAFLTFSKTPPMASAVNVKSSGFSANNLPKVITEIVSSDSIFSSSEYAILHCNGKIWEIHGSLNIAFGKSDKNVEKIFSCSPLPELKNLQETAHDVLKVNAVKWWIMDLTQKFSLIEIRTGNSSAVLTRKKFLELVEFEFQGFLPILKDTRGRTFGVFVIEPLLPFVLMGPFYLLEPHNMILKGDYCTLPFKYFSEENVPKNSPLKLFINSVIKNVTSNDKVLEGLWLYDKINMDNTSYLEIITKNLKDSPKNKSSLIDIEHGYSLNSAANSSVPNTVSPVKSKPGLAASKKLTVYLYFDVFELGYVQGELQSDNSVIINHPLDGRTKVKSHKVGDWFIRTIRRKIEFIPSDIVVRWFITKHKEDMRERRPFNKFLLSGAHILTRNGVFYMLEMTNSKIEKLGLEKTEVAKAISENQIVKIFLEMKNLANLLSFDSSKILTLGEVLKKTRKEIKTLKAIKGALKCQKQVVERQKLNLVSSFLETLGSCEIDDDSKIQRIESIEHLFVKENGDLSPRFVEKLNETEIGRKYYERIKKFDHLIEEIQEDKSTNVQKEKTKTGTSKREKCQPALTKNTKSSKPSLKKTTVDETNVPNTSEPSTQSDEKKEKVDENKQNDSPDNQSSSLTNTSSEDIKSPPQKDTEVKHNVQNRTSKKTDGFLKLTSPGLPENIKLSWKDKEQIEDT